MYEFPRYDQLKKQIIELVNSDVEEHVVGFSLDKILQDVATYTNLSVKNLPAKLDLTLVAMCVQLIQTQNITANDNINSISEGDVSVSFGSPINFYAQLQDINTISDDFVSILNQFRKLKHD